MEKFAALNTMTDTEVIITTDDGEKYIGDVKDLTFDEEIDHGFVMHRDIEIEVSELFKEDT